MTDIYIQMAEESEVYYTFDQDTSASVLVLPLPKT